MTCALGAADPITPGWLTEALRVSGALPRGEVIACETRANDAFNSAVVHLSLTYSDDAPDTAPRQLFLKRNIASAWAVEAARDEVVFYQTVAGLADAPAMLTPCYLAAFDAERAVSSLLLADVSATHQPPLTRDDLLSGAGVPAEDAMNQAIDALAGFHAYWWERPELGSVFPLGGWYGTSAHFNAHVERRRGEWARFLADEGEWLPADLRAIYDDALARLPTLWEAGLAAHFSTRRGLTLAHGDCYFSQFLVPRPGIVAPTYLVDFQSAAPDLTAFDLVLLLAAFWTRDQRRQGDRELRCLRRYHANLLAAGVRGYTWEDLLADYRLVLTVMLFYPVWDQTNGSLMSYWEPKMRCLAAAYQDHVMGQPR